MKTPYARSWKTMRAREVRAWASAAWELKVLGGLLGLCGSFAVHQVVLHFIRS